MGAVIASVNVRPTTRTDIIIANIKVILGLFALWDISEEEFAGKCKMSVAHLHDLLERKVVMKLADATRIFDAFIELCAGVEVGIAYADFRDIELRIVDFGPLLKAHQDKEDKKGD